MDLHAGLSGGRMCVAGLFLWCLLLGALDVRAQRGCEELPVFSPSPLVVKRGDFATATCSICNNSCDYELRLEEAYQSSFERGNQMVWNISSLRLPWSVNILCYIFDRNCPTVSLDVIVYKPPENVSASFKNRSGSSLESPSGPLKEGQVYCLQCEVEAVAPAQNMKVTFYRDFRELLVMRSSKTEKHPVSESFCLDYSVSKEDHGATFWCEARLELGPAGPQSPPVVRSHNITAVVHYAPYSEGPEEPQLLTVNQGQSAELVCRAEGNPPPLYSWSLPSGSDYRGPVLTIPSASSQHEGPYTCTASNALGAVNRSFTLTVHDVTTTAAPAAPTTTTATPYVCTMSASTSVVPQKTTVIPETTAATAEPVPSVKPTEKNCAGESSFLHHSLCTSIFVWVCWRVVSLL